MKKRYCDGCKQEIPQGEAYMKVCRQDYKDHKQQLKHIGDLCETCWNKVDDFEEKYKWQSEGMEYDWDGNTDSKRDKRQND